MCRSGYRLIFIFVVLLLDSVARVLLFVAAVLAAEDLNCLRVAFFHLLFLEMEAAEPVLEPKPLTAYVNM